MKNFKTISLALWLLTLDSEVNVKTVTVVDIERLLGF